MPVLFNTILVLAAKRQMCPDTTRQNTVCVHHIYESLLLASPIIPVLKSDICGMIKFRSNQQKCCKYNSSNYIYHVLNEWR